MTDSTNNQPASKAPSHIAYHVRNREGGEGFWTRIGSAWAHKDGKALAAAIRIATRDCLVVRTQPVARRFANCARSLCVWHAFTTSIYDELPI